MSPREFDDEGTVSRRALLRTAAVSGTLVWAAPVVQTLAPAAQAAGTPPPGLGTGLSYVTVLLKSGSTFYRIKYEADGAKVEIGTFKTPVCGTFPATPQEAKGREPSAVVRSATFAAGSFQLVLKTDVTLVDWVAKQGTCCISKSGGTAAGYTVAATPGTPSGTAYLFPPAPNKAPCSLLAATSTSAPAAATGTATTRR